MKQKIVTLSLITFFILLTVLLTPATSNALDKESYYSNQKNNTSPISASDPVIDPFINWPLFYAVQQTGMIDAGFDCFGRFGFNEPTPSADPWSYLQYKKFTSPANSTKEYLFGGSVWVGAVVGTDTLVSTTFDGWSSSNEFKPPQYPDSGSVNKFISFSDFSMNSISTDTFPAIIDYSGRPHIPLNVKINNRGHVFRRDTLENVIFYDILLTNFGEIPLEQTYIGFYFDCDIGDRSNPNTGIAHIDDYSGSIREHGIGYSIDNDGDPYQEGPVREFDANSIRKIFASKVIGCSQPIIDTNYNWWVSNANSNLDFGPRMRGTVDDPFRDFGTGGLGTPEGDANKYYIMRHNEWDYDDFRLKSIGPDDSIWLDPPTQEIVDLYSYGLDTRFLMSYGPFDILPDSSIRIILINFTADSVHIDPYNLSNLPNNPDTYFENLRLDDLLLNLNAAENMVDSFFNPAIPVSGLKTIFSSTDSVVVEWDQWEAPEGNDIEGFELYLGEVDPGMFPYPGIVPPWIEPVSLNHFTSLGKETKITISTLENDKYYLLNIAHRSASGEGDPGKPIAITPRNKILQPTFDHEYLFYATDSSARLQWNSPEELEIDHFNIYKFDSLAQYNRRYLPFYNEGYNPDILLPVDSFNVENQMYYYFEMDKYAVVEGTSSNFIDFNPVDGSYYAVTAVDISGHEHSFSRPIKTVEISVAEKDILVFINAYASTQPYMTSTAYKKTFYQSILSEYSFDIYSLFDSVLTINCSDASGSQLTPCYTIKDLTKYHTIIIDEDWKDLIINKQSEPNEKNFTKFVLNGGKLINFGTLSGLERDINFSDVSKPVNSDFVKRFFGIESISFYQFLKNITIPVQEIDSIYAFSFAEPADNLTPALYLDTTIDFLAGFTGPWAPLWPDNSPPNVATFELDDRGELMHYFRSQFPQSSYFENLPVGIKTKTDISETYLFGFHLYYMKQPEAKQLIDFIVKDIAATAQPVTFIDPQLVYTFWANNIEPQEITIQFGQLTDRHVSEIDISSLQVNSSLVPVLSGMIPPPQGYFGDFIELQTSMRDFILGYGLMHDVVDTTFTISGNYTDGESFEIKGQVTFRAHVFGDMNDDRVTDISDLIMFVRYMYQQGTAPEPLSRADLNNDNIVDIGDLVKLIEFMFYQ